MWHGTAAYSYTDNNCLPEIEMVTERRFSSYLSAYFTSLYAHGFPIQSLTISICYVGLPFVCSPFPAFSFHAHRFDSGSAFELGSFILKTVNHRAYINLQGRPHFSPLTPLIGCFYNRIWYETASPASCRREVTKQGAIPHNRLLSRCHGRLCSVASVIIHSNNQEAPLEVMRKDGSVG